MGLKHEFISFDGIIQHHQRERYIRFQYSASSKFWLMSHKYCRKSRKNNDIGVQKVLSKLPGRSGAKKEQLCICHQKKVKKASSSWSHYSFFFVAESQSKPPKGEVLNYALSLMVALSTPVCITDPFRYPQ